MIRSAVSRAPLRAAVPRLAARSAGKAPKHASRPAAKATPAASGPPPPTVQPPPPAPQPGPAAAGGEAGAAGGGGGFGSQLLMIVFSIGGTFMAFALMSRIFGPRRVTVIHKDQDGNVIDRQSGRGY
eukprot:TRINITY_DN17522_c0_g1_i1.p2 TRINITY_DN17522_c0_g1~~TRINITY_DN17522_c0_g1_i1.p2  ORF type:complete len:127 (+),score=21.36 TRINITY_DN17522_c0_g1_i1:46-426(+)